MASLKQIFSVLLVALTFQKHRGEHLCVIIYRINLWTPLCGIRRGLGNLSDYKGLLPQVCCQPGLIAWEGGFIPWAAAWAGAGTWSHFSAAMAGPQQTQSPISSPWSLSGRQRSIARAGKVAWPSRKHSLLHSGVVSWMTSSKLDFW